LLSPNCQQAIRRDVSRRVTLLAALKLNLERHRHADMARPRFLHATEQHDVNAYAASSAMSPDFTPAYIAEVSPSSRSARRASEGCLPRHGKTRAFSRSAPYLMNHPTLACLIVRKTR
jgi:hypothetical protein